MKTYQYVAKKDGAQTVKGRINAQSQEQAVDLINQLGFLPVSVVPQPAEAKSVRRSRPRRVSPQDVATFSRQLAHLLKSGVSIIKALRILEEQTQHLYFRQVIGEILQDVKNGASFSESLQKYPRVFSPLYVTMVTAGEEGGNLQQMLINVARYLKRQSDIRWKVKTAMTYPLFMLGLGIVTVYFVLTFILPKMRGLFDNIGSRLPWPTAALLRTSDFLGEYWYILAAVILAVGYGLRRWSQSVAGKRLLSAVMLRLPLFGSIVLRAELARFARTLVLMHRGGVPFLRSLETAIPILSNDVIKKDLAVCMQSLTSGGTFGEGVKQSKDIPAMMGHLISVGEESGNVDDVLEEIADTYEQETDEQIKVMTTLLEPVMILSVGLIIGFIVFAMLLPVFDIDVLNQ
ncbi:MAG: type II secretion system F family protein [Candidatus Omnitrophica bacterium]|nr:type II secretion system F family protein [Candidatus Omnitrophota bacterium]MCB9722345.1 type II secretion system F family protein [Candidatus Omnitrophota bacterium]